MRILFVSNDTSGISLCHILVQEGQDVRLFIRNRDKRLQKTGDGMVKKVEDLNKGIEWAGKDSLIVFDYTGFGKLQKKLRLDGYSVVGGSELGDMLENNRQYEQKILSINGIKTVPSISFKDINKAIEFLKRHKGPWVIKQNGESNKTLNCVGAFSDNRDIISLLKNYNRNKKTKNECSIIDLQKKIKGIEIAVGRFFNGNDWIGPCNINFEHKNLCNENLGPKTPEMGTLMWYEENEKNPLFSETLAKMKNYLKSIDYRGYIDINCIVNETGIFPLEVTARFGYPTIELQAEFHSSPWSEFLKATADGKNYDLKWKKGYGVVVLIATPPFPFHRNLFSNFSLEGTNIYFKKNFKKEDSRHIHFEGVAQRKNKDYYICDHIGYVLHASELGETVESARKKTYELINKIVIPKMYYRTDIGLKFIQEDRKKLKEWGYI